MRRSLAASGPDRTASAGEQTCSGLPAPGARFGTRTEPDARDLARRVRMAGMRG